MTEFVDKVTYIVCFDGKSDKVTCNFDRNEAKVTKIQQCLTDLLLR